MVHVLWPAWAAVFIPLINCIADIQLIDPSNATHAVVSVASVHRASPNVLRAPMFASASHVTLLIGSYTVIPSGLGSKLLPVPTAMPAIRPEIIGQMYKKLCNVLAPWNPLLNENVVLPAWPILVPVQ